MNETQFRDIYQKHEPMVRTVLFRMVGASDLDDLVQEAFIKIFRAVDEFKGESELKTWIYRVTVNTAHDYYRAKKRRSWLQFFGDWSDKSGPSNQVESESALMSDGSSSVNRLEAKHDIEVVLRELSPKLRETIILFSIEELSLEDISQILKIPVGTVKSRISLAKREMAQLLERKKA